MYLALGDIEAALAILAVPEQLDVPLAEHAFGWRYLFLAQGTALLAAGQADDARRVAERALALAQERGEPPQSAYARKLLGDVARAGGKSNAALATRHYEEALALAEQCAMRPLVRLPGKKGMAAALRRQAGSAATAASAITRVALMPGRKKYAPPRTVTNGRGLPTWRLDGLL